MFDGIIILNAEKVPTAYGWGWNPIGWIFIGLMILGLALMIHTVITTHKKKLDYDHEATRCGNLGIAFVAIIIGAVVTIILNCDYKKKDYVMEYKATISDLTPFTYVMENYDVVDHAGEIWTLRSKEIIDEVD